ncbi:hypothetical protein I3843_03G054200 [Carya illinoinensis]|nr:hypothetical protein I3843_03G054200 [Carya illinoinensis]
MALLDWMHHKFRNSSIEPIKDFIIAQPSLDDQDTHMKPSFGSTYGPRSFNQAKHECEKYFSDTEAKREEDKVQEETSAVICELFHGFLTIGTLNLEPIINEPATPTFAMPLESITESKTELTDNDLKLINYELEKFLEAETKEECGDVSSGRNSHASTITLSGKLMDEAETECYEKILVCPLQGYLFGSSIELPETRKEVKKEKTSLEELFLRTKMTNEKDTEKIEGGNMQAMKAQKSAMHHVKKMLKKLHASSRNSVPSNSGDAAESISTKKILRKVGFSELEYSENPWVIRMFHKKIHPETTIAARDFADSHTNKVNNAPNRCYNNKEHMYPGADNNGFFTLGSMSKMGIPCHKSNLKPPQDRLHGSNLSAKEHWIKTDAEYLVLEL